MAIASKGKGKSGGARVITYIYIQEKTVYLLSIYDKSDHTSISDAVIRDLIKSLDLE
jgi:mRNA-degrading endonuclease RelE of RelBE toxin-antitoxin system